MHVFSELVAARGYSDTSIGDVASELGISKGTVVHHFGTKQQLLSEVHAQYLARRFFELNKIRTELVDPVAQLAGVIYALLASHRDDRSATLTFLREFIRHVEGGLSEHVRQQRRLYRDSVTDIIREGVAAGDFNVTDTTLATMQVFGICNYAWTWFRPDGLRSVEEVADFMSRSTILGLAGENGPQLRERLDVAIREAIRLVESTPGRIP